MKKNNLAFREAYLAGRIGIRAKILIYLAILAGFIISSVWMLQGMLFYRMTGGRPAADGTPAVIIRNVEQGEMDALKESLGEGKEVSVFRLDETVRTQFFLIAGFILLATGLVGFTMARSISEPIIQTNLAARELSRSRYSRPAHIGGYREIAELNDTLVQAGQDLGRVEDLQRELIANISHDLRTPLTMIEGYAEAMRDIPEEVTPENMQIIIDETNRLSSMVNEVLDFSRLRTGNLELDRKPFRLTGQIREIVNRVGRMTAVDGYRVLFDPAEERTVTGDSGRIGQVLYNLLGNALTYTGKDKTVRIIQQDRGSRVRVEISDTGEGIPEAELPYIWDRYYRSRDNHRRAVIGSGLGLNICRGILEKHGAEYGVKSEEGTGTTFWFELPRASEAETAEEA